MFNFPAKKNSESNKKLVDAICSKDEKLCEELLSINADPNTLNDQGVRVLSLAIYLKNPAIVSLLLKYNADINAKNQNFLNRDETQIDYALKYANAECLELILNSKEELKLIKKELLSALPAYQLVAYRSPSELKQVAYHKLGLPEINLLGITAYNRFFKNVSHFPPILEGVHISGEGFNDYMTMPLIVNALTKYVAQMDTSSPFYEAFKEIEESFKFTANELDDSDDYLPFVNSLALSISEGKLTVILSGWEDHSITLVALNDYLMICDKGQGGEIIGPIAIYQLKNKLNKSDIFTLIEQHREERSYNSSIRNVVALCRNKLFSLPGTYQKYGTCSYTNKKAAVKGMLFLKWLQKNPNWKETKDNEIDGVINDINNQYKDFTTFDRDSYIKTLIHVSNLMEHPYELIDLIGLYLIWHSDNINEVNQFKKYISLFNRPNKERLFNRIIQTNRNLVEDLKTLTKEELSQKIYTEVLCTAVHFPLTGQNFIVKALAKDDLQYISFILQELRSEINVNGLLIEAIIAKSQKIIKYLLEKEPSIDLNYRSQRYPFSALECLIKSNDETNLEKCIKVNPQDLNFTMANGDTPLTSAFDKPSMTKLLLKYNAKINFPDRYCVTSLQKAIKEHDLKILNIYILADKLKEFSINEKFQALYLFCGQGDEYKNAIENLLDSGLIEQMDSKQINTLLFHAIRNKNFKLSEQLILKGADVNAQDENQTGLTPLIVAACCNDFDIFSLLLSHHANAEIKSKSNLDIHTVVQKLDPRFKNALHDSINKEPKKINKIN